MRRSDDPAAAGRPSPRARERLEERFATELGLTRAAWDDALRRSDERWSQDDAAGVVESLEDQRRLLQLLEHRLCEVVSSAAVEREAERVVGTVAFDAAPSDAAEAAFAPRAPGTTAADGVAASPAGVPDPARSRHQALAGAGAAVAATIVAIAVAVTLGLGSPPVPEVAAPVEESDTAAGPAAGVRDRHVAVAGQHAARALDPASTRTNWLQELRTVDLDPTAQATGTGETPGASPETGAMAPPHLAGDGTSGRPTADEMADGSSAEGPTPNDEAPRGGDGQQPESGDEADPADGPVLPELADLGSGGGLDDGTEEGDADDTEGHETEGHDTEGHDVGGDDVEGHELHRRDVDGSLPDAGEELR